MYDNPWTYLEQTFDSDDVGDNFGFVYEITNVLNGRHYIEESISGLLERHLARKENKNKRVIGKPVLRIVSRTKR